MDVRDYFAGQALSSLIKDGQDYKKEKNIQKLVALAYQIADALLEARERPAIPPLLPEAVAVETLSQSAGEKIDKKNKSQRSKEVPPV